jgi:hypothetical protein
VITGQHGAATVRHACPCSMSILSQFSCQCYAACRNVHITGQHGTGTVLDLGFKLGAGSVTTNLFMLLLAGISR